MEFKVELDKAELSKIMRGFESDINSVIRNTINDSMVEAQTAFIASATSTFTIRRPKFLKQSIKISQFAKKENLTGTLEVADVGGKKTKDILGQHEGGGQKISTRGGDIAIPTLITRGNSKRLVSAAKKPRALENAFVINTKRGAKLLMYRKGKKQKLEVAYVLQHSVPLKPQLHFIDNVMGTLNSVINKNFNAAFNKVKAKRLAA